MLILKWRRRDCLALGSRKIRKMDVGLGTWHVRSLYRAGSLLTVAERTMKIVRFSESTRCQGSEVAPNQQKNTHFSLQKGMGIINFAEVLFLHKRIISAIKWVEYFSDRMLYIILRGRLCHIIVLNVHAPAEDKIDVNCIPTYASPQYVKKSRTSATNTGTN
jgi:hypothetical protein